LQVLLHALAVQGRGQEVGHRLQEVHVGLGEVPASRRVRRQHPERPAASPHDHAHAADHALFQEQGGRLEPRLTPQVLDDDRLAGEQGITGLGLGARADRGPPGVPLFPARAGPQQQGVAIRQQFQDVTVFHTQQAGHARDGFLQPGRKIDSPQGQLAQLGDGRLLPHPDAQLFLGAANADQRVDVCDQLARLHGLGQVGVRPDFQPLGPVGAADALTGELQDGDAGRRRVGLEPAADLETTQVGKTDVQEDQVGLLGRPEQRLRPGGGFADGKALRAEEPGEQFPVGGIVIDVEDGERGLD
jgi:hypothetical protein